MTRDVYGFAVGIIFEVTGTECDALVQHHMRTDDGRFANHDTGSMVDTEIVTNLCRRMDIDTGSGMCQFSQHARNTRHTQVVEHMRCPKMNHLKWQRIRENDFAAIGNCRVVVQYRIHIGVDQARDRRYLCPEGLRQTQVGRRFHRREIVREDDTLKMCHKLFELGYVRDKGHGLRVMG